MSSNGLPVTGSGSIQDIYPLTPMQNGILFHVLRAARNGPYIEQFVFEVRGQLDPARFVRAWTAVVDRHPVLRTAFVWEGVDEPVQVVVAGREVPLSEVDLRGSSVDEFEKELAVWLADDRERGFRLTEAPLMRLSLLRHGGGVVLVWTLHHLIMDGWSMPITIAEVATAYRALGAGRPPALPDARPFRDFVAWAQRSDPTGAQRFWRERLAGMTPTRVGEVRPDPGERAGTATDGRAYHDLGAELSAAVASAARAGRVTLSTVFQAAWGLLLARHTGSRDVVFGTTVSGRPAELPGVEGIVGVFINTIPHRMRLDGHQSVRAWLAEVQQRHLDTLPYQHAGLNRIRGWTDLPGGEPLFDSIVVFENYPSENPDFDLGDGSALLIREIVEDAGYPLTLTVLPRTPSNRLQLLYDPCRYPDEAALTLLSRYDAVLRTIAAHLESPVDRLDIPTYAVPGAAAAVPASEPELPGAGTDGFFDGSPAAEAMRVLWSEVLGREITDPDSDFFRMGGDSLAAVRLVGRLRTVLPGALPVSAVFEDRTLRRLLERVRQHDKDGTC